MQAIDKNFLAKETSLSGSLDSYNNGLLEGWAYASNAPQLRLRLSVFIDGEPVMTGVADRFREDLQRADILDPQHAFRIVLPEEVCDGKLHEVDIKVFDTGVSLPNCPRKLHLQPVTGIYWGRLDSASYPVIAGWAWNERDPKEALDIECYADERHLLTVKADRYREDLERAGIGDGRKSFEVAIPFPLAPGKQYAIKA